MDAGVVVIEVLIIVGDDPGLGPDEPKLKLLDTDEPWLDVLAFRGDDEDKIVAAVVEYIKPLLFEGDELYETLSYAVFLVLYPERGEDVAVKDEDELMNRL